MISSNTFDVLRSCIRQHTHADEAECVARLITESSVDEVARDEILAQGRNFVQGCREDADLAGSLDVFMQEFSLSSKEGVALMCLAESLLRVPDAETADDLIAEKILSGDWSDHLGQSDSLFVNASTWGLMLTGRVVSLENEITNQTDSWLKKMVNRLGEPVIRTAVRQAMKIMGQQYVLGRSITEAISRGRNENGSDTRFSFDMLGEGARTAPDAKRYFDGYLAAIREIGEHQKSQGVIKGDGISVKLSALHPRYQYLQEQRVFNELYPQLLALATEAKQLGLGFSIDAEEADRLDISLDLFESLAREPALGDWDGLGFVLQAYGKRAPFVVDWLIALGRDSNRKLMVRLVKGAYWDTEIKYAQEEGYKDYPVYTSKVNTDLSYQICAARLLDAQDVIYPQFATHNAHTVAMILSLVNNPDGSIKSFEFQRLHGMGDLLYRRVLQQHKALAVRVYAPVGEYRDLLPYLVRRLLENGANSSFVNRFMDKKVPVEEVITDVQSQVELNPARRHRGIPTPRHLFRASGEQRDDTHGIDFANAEVVSQLLSTVDEVEKQRWAVGPIIDGVEHADHGEPVICPADHHKVIGSCRRAESDEVVKALESAASAQASWDQIGGNARADILEKAAEEMEARMPELVAMIAFEAGRTLNDGVSEVREAVDFLRYYALQAREHYQGKTRLEGPLGDIADYQQKGRGVFFCISPWNFPLAIFIGQVAAALAAGNSVIAKPADPTPIIASEGIKLLHAAGVPVSVLQFVPGRGRVLGDILNHDSRVKGVAFTGSTEVALGIQKTLVERGGDLPCFIAETGGQNTMIVDSSALPEQVVDDAIRSAFLSAGQRCSALRVLYLQDDIADGVIEMLVGAMKELSIGMPWLLSTDVGPIIDQKARSGLLKHIENMKQRKAVKFHYACEMPEGLESATFLAPHLFELNSINELPGEVFGPILHIVRFNKAKFDRVLDEINDTGFGLTLGVHSRIEHFAQEVVAKTRVGNNYINRNIIGAVVGVNPFGGQGLSGTGPKAGGPNYLPRFGCLESEWVKNQEGLNLVHQKNTAVNKTTEQEWCKIMAEAIRHESAWNRLGAVKRAILFNIAADTLTTKGSDLTESRLESALRFVALQANQIQGEVMYLPGPTGETNQLLLQGRGVYFCGADASVNLLERFTQTVFALAAGNCVITHVPADQYNQFQSWLEPLFNAGVPRAVLQLVTGEETVELACTETNIAGFAWLGKAESVMKIQLALLERGGPIATVLFNEINPKSFQRYTVEKTITVNIVATGGNALLLNMSEV